jgi:murein DD-endopeptidase MepM/ murein hydrolase activator NlpD
MKNKIHISLLLILLSGFFTLTLAGGNVDDKNKKKKKKPVSKSATVKSTVKNTIKRDDTLTVKSADLVFLDAVDSLLMFPSHDLYGSWDTAVFHPNLFEQQFTSDSAVVYLTDEWNCGFSMPYKGIVTSEFGWRRRRPHYGTDINLETGDTVVAAFDGKVRIARFNKSYGNVVVIRHNNGLETVYAHLSKINVQADEEVTAGTLIGLGGNTGRSYGSHLHFEIRYLGKAIDTKDMIDYEKGELKNASFVIFKEDFAAKYDLRHIHNQKYAKSHAAPKSAGSHYVTVRNGDTLGRIAKRNHTTINAICKKNGIKPTKVLRVGQRLKV